MSTEEQTAAAPADVNLAAGVTAKLDPSEPPVSLRDMMEAGMHFGHQTRRM